MESKQKKQQKAAVKGILKKSKYSDSDNSDSDILDYEVDREVEILIEDEGQGGICAVWDFRANEDYYESSQILEFIKSNAKKYAFQLEESDTGYRHWQGRFSLIKKRQKGGLIKLFANSGLKVPNYLKPTSKENHKDDFFYSLKADTRVGEPFMDKKHAAVYGNKSAVYIPAQYAGIKFYPFQQSIVDMIQQFDSRIIDVIVDISGNNGKSTLASLCELMHGCIDMPLINDYKETVSLLCNICMDTDNRKPKGIFFDMPRAMSKESLHGFYSAIEQIKKGKLYDCRYHYKSYWIDSPRIFIFTNKLPDMKLLSADRWRLWFINEKRELVAHNISDIADY